MVLDPITQSLPVHFFVSRPQPPTSRPNGNNTFTNDVLGKSPFYLPAINTILMYTIDMLYICWNDIICSNQNDIRILCFPSTAYFFFHMHVRTHTNTHTHVHNAMQIYIFTNICMHLCIYVCMHVCGTGTCTTQVSCTVKRCKPTERESLTASRPLTISPHCNSNATHCNKKSTRCNSNRRSQNSTTEQSPRCSCSRSCNKTNLMQACCNMQTRKCCNRPTQSRSACLNTTKNLPECLRVFRCNTLQHTATHYNTLTIMYPYVVATGDTLHSFLCLFCKRTQRK